MTCGKLDSFLIVQILCAIVANYNGMTFSTVDLTWLTTAILTVECLLLGR